MVKLCQKVLILIVLGLWFIACGDNIGERTLAESSETLDGQALFESNGCLGCHAIEANAGYKAGPSMVGLIERAAQIIADPNYSGEAETVKTYIEEAILKPNIYVNEGYEPLMPTTYETTLNAVQIEAITNYLLILP